MIKNILALLFLFVSTLSFAQDNIAKSLWISSPGKIDGNAQEWSLPLKYYDPGTKLFFAFSNDDKNLYLCFQSNDEMNQTKIMRGGMKVSLSARGKHKIAVSFPLAQQAAPAAAPVDNNGQQYPDRKNKRTTFLAQNTMMDVTGFSTKNGLISINDSTGINAAINWDESDKLTYEMAIPFKEWFGTNYTMADIPKDISLEIEVNAVKRQNHTGSVSGGDGFSGRGGRMGGGGGMHHQRNTNADTDDESSVLPGEDRENMYEKSKHKEKFVLALNGNEK